MSLALEQPTKRKAITTFWGDVLLIGGFSVVFCLIISVLPVHFGEPMMQTDKRIFFVLTLLFNWPHFMASYRLIYVGRDATTKHPWATVRIPALLIFLTVLATALSTWSLYLNGLLAAIAFAYLAWHYTGQTWGMIMVFSVLDGITMNTLERKLLRANLHILVGWHLVWFLEGEGGLVRALFPATEPFYVNLIQDVYQLASMMAAVSCLLGLWAFVSIRKRTGQLPSLRMFVPWLALYLWYGLMAREGVHGLFWVQIFHALQYLAFPIRVEVNRRNGGEGSSRLSPTTFAILYYIVLLAMTLLFLSGALRGLGHVLSTYIGPEVVGSALVTTFLSCFNIHHYVIDQVAWKIRNPDVQKDLFSHL
jgi:hypothetical protein